MNSLGESGGKTAFSTGAQQADSALGAFEGIFEQLAALASGEQVAQGPLGKISAAVAQPEDSANPQQTSKNSKQAGGQFSQLPNGSFLMNNEDPTGLLTAAAGDAAKETSSKDASAGSIILKETQGGKQPQAQADTANAGLDPAMIAAATAAALQVQNTQTLPVGNKTSPKGDQIGAVTDVLTSSGKQAAAGAKSFLTELSQAGKQTSADVASKAGEAAASTETEKLSSPSADTAQNATSSAHLSEKQSFSAQLQSQSNNLSAASVESAKKQSGQPEVGSTSEKDSKVSSSSMAANVQGSSQQQSFAPGNQVVPGVENNTGQAATVRSSPQANSLTAEELSAIRAANAKKSGTQAKSGTEADIEGLASVSRAGSQSSPTGSSASAVTQNLGAQSGTNPFGALDSAPAHDQQAQILRATHREVEVGVQDPRFGWVEVKTQMNAGQVSASLSVNSVEAQHALQHELPAMQHFVASRDLNLTNISVSTGTDSNGAGAFSQQSGQGTGEQNQSFSQVPVGEAWRGQPSSPVPSTTTESVWMPETASRISVMA